MKVVVAGASGFLGRAWTQLMTEHGHQVVRLVRREPDGPDESRWNPSGGVVDQLVIDSADVVVNLAGANVGHFPWTETYEREFVASRIDTTRVLSEAVARADGSPALLSQSGVAGYGDRGAEVVTEDTPIDADSFMADVVRQWEAATEPAKSAGRRVVTLRTSVVLDRRGGALKSMLLPFKLGMGGVVGSGDQYFATISLDDWVRAATFLAVDDDMAGTFNVTGPDCSTNAEFTEELGKALHRPTVLKVPAFPLRKFAGPIGGEMLASTRVEPHRLLEAGFAFSHNDVADRIAAALR
ncbi:MAG: uncharacterized protein QOK15_3645 [Nocardioidaceae bacterium]|jgi:uncharacterized protein (TIGR01777 family)|nr:uncharacterized protein [Nocardioidaceae bacterium]